jgi:hypothetical protein
MLGAFDVNVKVLWIQAWSTITKEINLTFQSTDSFIRYVKKNKQTTDVDGCRRDEASNDSKCPEN